MADIPAGHLMTLQLASSTRSQDCFVIVELELTLSDEDYGWGGGRALHNGFRNLGSLWRQNTCIRVGDCFYGGYGRSKDHL